MATNIQAMDALRTDVDDLHREMFCIIWLDDGENALDARNTDKKLRSIINHLKKFEDVELCQTFIKERSEKERVVMIVSGRLGREIVPSIHKLRQVISIYVYCMDKKSNKRWANDFSKVKSL